MISNLYIPFAFLFFLVALLNSVDIVPSEVLYLFGAIALIFGIISMFNANKEHYKKNKQ